MKRLKYHISTLLTSALTLCFCSCQSTQDLFSSFGSGSDASGSTSSPSQVAIESNSGRVLFASTINAKRPIGMLTTVSTAAVVHDWVQHIQINPCKLITVPA